MCERSGFRWFHWFHWCFGELLMEVWSDPPIKSEPDSEGDHAKLCKYVKCGWILQGPGIFRSDPIFRQELTYPGYPEIIYALLLATTFACHIMNFRATFIVSRTLHPSNIGLPEKNKHQESELASGNTELDPVVYCCFDLLCSAWKTKIIRKETILSQLPIFRRKLICRSVNLDLIGLVKDSTLPMRFFCFFWPPEKKQPTLCFVGSMYPWIAS